MAEPAGTLAQAGLATPISGLRRRILGGGAWAFAAKATLALGALISNALVARLLEPADVGAFFLLTSLVAVASLCAQFGVQKAVVRGVAGALAREEVHLARVAATDAVLLVLAMSVPLAALFAFAGAPFAARVFDSPALTALSLSAALWIVARAMQSLLAECFRGFHDLRLASLFGGIVQVALLLGGLAALGMLSRTTSLADVVHVVTASFALGAAGAAVLLWRRLAALPSGSLAPGALMRIAAPLGIASLVTFSLTQVDIWIVGAVLGAEPVAAYGAAAKLTQVIAMPLIVVNAVVPPMIAQMHAQGRLRELETMLQRIALVAAVPAITGAVVLVAAGDDVLTMLFGPWYREAASILAVLVIGQAVNVCSGSCGSVLTMTGHQWLMLRIAATTGALALPAAWVGAEVAGTLGVALVMASAIAAQNLSMLIAVRRRLGIWTSPLPGAWRTSENAAP